ncbi:hypothetical protein AMECASPLE_019534 [Ameca splendens]|uniref:Secreted protein n=1 Tax=Ameca splendens TaxID=208324 RepID=A0ABV0XS67_9TELE
MIGHCHCCRLLILILFPILFRRGSLMNRLHSLIQILFRRGPKTSRHNFLLLLMRGSGTDWLHFWFLCRRSLRASCPHSQIQFLFLILSWRAPRTTCLHLWFPFWRSSWTSCLHSLFLSMRGARTHFLHLLCLSGSAADLQAPTAVLQGPAKGPSGFRTARQGATVVLGLPSSTAGFLVAVLQTIGSEGLLHGWARFVVGASGSAADLLNSGFGWDVLLVVLLNRFCFLAPYLGTFWVVCYISPHMTDQRQSSV